MDKYYYRGLREETQQRILALLALVLLDLIYATARMMGNGVAQHHAVIVSSLV